MALRAFAFGVGGWRGRSHLDARQAGAFQFGLSITKAAQFVRREDVFRVQIWVGIWLGEQVAKVATRHLAGAAPHSEPERGGQDQRYDDAGKRHPCGPPGCPRTGGRFGRLAGGPGCLKFILGQRRGDYPAAWRDRCRWSPATPGQCGGKGLDVSANVGDDLGPGA